MNTRLIKWLSQAQGPGDREAHLIPKEIGLSIALVEWYGGDRLRIERSVSWEQINSACIDIIDRRIAEMIDELKDPRGSA